MVEFGSVLTYSRRSCLRIRYPTLLIDTKSLCEQYIKIETEIDVKVCFYELNSSKQAGLNNMMELCVGIFIVVIITIYEITDLKS